MNETPREEDLTEKEKQRNKVLEELRERLGIKSDGSQDNVHPVLLLCHDAELRAWNALVSCYSQYTNFLSLVEARNIQGKEQSTVFSWTKELAKYPTVGQQILFGLREYGTEEQRISESLARFIAFTHLGANAVVQRAKKEAKDERDKKKRYELILNDAQSEVLILETQLQKTADGSEVARLKAEIGEKQNKVAALQRKIPDIENDESIAIAKIESAKSELSAIEDLVSRLERSKGNVFDSDGATTSNRTPIPEGNQQESPRQKQSPNFWSGLFSQPDASRGRTTQATKVASRRRTLIDKGDLLDDDVNPFADSDRNAFVEFLIATDKLAMELLEELTRKHIGPISIDIFVGGFVRACIGDDYRRKDSLLRETDGLRSIVSTHADILSLAQNAYLKEREYLLKDSDRNPGDAPTYPDAYTNPFSNLMDLEIKHGYLSARVACAALCFTQQPNNFIKKLPSIFWVKGYTSLSTHKGSREYETLLEDAPTEFCGSLIEYYFLPVDKKNGKKRKFSSESDLSDQWRSALGSPREGASSTELLMIGTKGDADTVAKVLAQLLMDESVSETAKIAIAVKLGAYFREVFEADCSSDHGSKFSATCQINHITDLCRKIINSPAIDNIHLQSTPIMQAAQLIYFKDRSLSFQSNLMQIQRQQLQDSCNWRHPDDNIVSQCRDPVKLDWKERSSVGHITPHNMYSPGGHLWLYGKTFQEKVDAVISSQENISVNSARFARFIFLVPAPRDDDAKTLSDYPGDPAIEHVLLHLEDSLAREGSSFNWSNELYDPIVRKAKPSSMFTPALQVLHSGAKSWTN
jgi:hypothetical protein